MWLIGQIARASTALLSSPTGSLRHLDRQPALLAFATELDPATTTPARQRELLAAELDAIGR